MITTAEDLLHQEDIMDFLKVELNSYFQTTFDNEIKVKIIWEAHKAVIKGNSTSLNSKHKKEKQQKFQKKYDKDKRKRIKKKLQERSKFYRNK